MKPSIFACLLTISTVAATALQATAAPVGSVICSSMRGEGRQNEIAFSAISPEGQGGYTLSIVEDTGSHILSLNQSLQVTNASSIEGQSLVPWNLIAYDGKPLSVNRDGTFSLDMMVSTRSSCQFRGTAIFLKGSEATLFRN